MRTSKADRNLFSISANVVQLYAGTDHAVTLNPVPVGSSIDCAKEAAFLDKGLWDSSLKVCDGTEGVALINIDANQGNENVIDTNAGAHHCSFQGEFGRPGQIGDQVITTKGGCHHLTFVGTIYSKGRNSDCVVGAWSDQSFACSTDLDYSQVKRADGQPVTFILARCKRVKLPSGAKVFRLKSIGYSLYNWAKLVLVKLHVL